MDANHRLKTFFRLVQAHSEAQPYYPALQMDQEVGSVFSDSRRIQIVWNASNALFHNELVNLNITRMDDFNGDYETCKTKLLFAEQHFQTRRTKAKAAEKDSEGKKSGKGKYKKGGKDANPKDTSKSGSKGDQVECGYCGGAHWQVNCFKDPNGPNYRPGKPASGASSTKFNPPNRNNAKRRGDLMSFDEWKEDEDSKKQRYLEYVNDESGTKES